MYNFLSLIGIIFALFGAGMSIVLLVTVANGQLPAHSLGVFITTSPFIFIIVAAFILTRRKM